MASPRCENWSPTSREKAVSYCVWSAAEAPLLVPLVGRFLLVAGALGPDAHLVRRAVRGLERVLLGLRSRLLGLLAEHPPHALELLFTLLVLSHSRTSSQSDTHRARPRNVLPRTCPGMQASEPPRSPGSQSGRATSRRGRGHRARIGCTERASHRRSLV